jgi:hypothetical protein
LRYQQKLASDHVISAGEVKIAEIKAQTAQHKLQFLTRLAQAAYDSAKRQLELQRRIHVRIQSLRPKGVPASEIDKDQRDFDAAQDRVKLIEMIPGIQTEKTAPPADDGSTP